MANLDGAGFKDRDAALRALHGRFEESASIWVNPPIVPDDHEHRHCAACKSTNKYLVNRTARNALSWLT